MTDLVTPPSPPSGSANVNTVVPTAGGVTVSPGQILYSTTLPTLFGSSDFDPNATSFTLTNAGTVWDDDPSGSQVMYVMNWGKIDNSGTIVAHSSNGSAQTLWVTSSFGYGLKNSGSIYALSDTGGAWAFADWSGDVVDNSGTIAARGGTAARTVFLANGGSLVNEVGGSILAEARDAVAVYLGRGHFQVQGQAPTATDVTNWGRIEAQSTDPSKASVAIYAAHLAGESMVIDNHGQIYGDYAIFSDSYAFSPPQYSQELITNESDGSINGEIYLDLGDDQIVNKGQITGYIDMGEGNDLVDTRSGVHFGTTDMGWGNDTYLGGSGADVVLGNRGDDFLSGGGGNDLLLGGWGNDTIQGDDGNDGLYGEGGDDTITTKGGDYVDAGEGNDRVILGDYSFASVNGGSGYDVLVLPTDSRILDLSQVVASNRISGFEEISITGSDEIVVRPTDVTGMGVTTLTISGSGSGIVDLAGSWTAGASQTIGGTLYDSYSSGVSQVLIAHGITVHVGAAPTGSGLDPVGAGGTAPSPGGDANLTSEFVTANGLELTSDLEIYAPEHWESNGGSPIITSFAGQITSLINRGTMKSDGGTGGASVISGYNFNNLFNYGTITASAFSGTSQLAQNEQMFATYGIYNEVNNMPGNAYGVDLGGGAQHFLNAGDIEVRTDETIAVGYLTYGTNPGENDGTINANSSDFIAVGAYTHNAGTFINTGTISATGAWGAYGLGSTEFGLNLVNSGTITAHATDAGHQGIAIDLYYATFTNQIFNSGTITGEIAIQSSFTVNGNNVWLDNSGHINGIIQFGLGPSGSPAREDVILNNGTINGDVFLGAGRDVYDGRHGTQIGTVYGQDGNDLLIGTSGHDTMDGGNGDDVLVGQGGDTLTGGAGHDTFVYASVTPGQVETITDFTSGTDVIDLRALAPSSVSISGSTVTAVTASGTLTIQAGGPVAMSDILTGATTAVTGTSGDDVLVAGPGGATLSGGDGFDLLVGGPGNDTLDGGLGGTNGIGETADVMFGGDGNDTYMVDSSADLVIENVNGGIDTIVQTTGLYNLPITLPENVENFVGWNGIGNDLDNIMTGTAGNDSLSGMGGNDVLTGGAGADTLTGGDGNDTFLDTAAGHNGDTITDFSAGDKIVITDASINNIMFGLSHNILSYSVDGNTFFSLTLTNVPSGHFVASAAPGGGVQLTIDHHQVHDDFNGDARSDILLRDDVSGWMTDWVGEIDGFLSDKQPNFSIHYSSDWHVAGTGDVNGDGRTDYILRSDAGWLTDWLGNADGSVSNNGANTSLFFTSDWHVAGFGDFNGDGKADMLLRSDAGWTTDWLGTSTGSFTNNGANTSLFFTSDWHVIGTGDFNGDGISDMLLRSDAGWTTDWLGTSTGSFTNNGANASLFFTSDWHVIGTGDFNGDGKADILLRSDAGWVTDWLGTANGGFTNNGANVSLLFAPDWHIASIGDFNGDGRDDILLRNDSGWMTDWLATPNGGFANNGAHFSVFVAPNWHVQDQANGFL